MRDKVMHQVVKERGLLQKPLMVESSRNEQELILAHPAFGQK